MSNLSRPKQLMIILILLSVLVAFYARAAEETLVDPTAPLFVPAGEDGEGLSLELMDGFSNLFRGYELSSILIRSNDRVAVINEQRVRVGDIVGIARITAIEPDRVTLNVDGEIQTLELHESSVKTLVKGKG